MDKKYDIRIYSRDMEGQFNKVREEYGVCADSPQELKAIYDMCDEKIEILRAYTDKSAKEVLPTIEEINRMPGNNVKLLPMPKIPGHTLPEQNTVDVSPKLNTDPVPVGSTAVPSQYQVQQQTIHVPTPQPIPPPKEEPQYFRIGGIDCKIENGHVFQKQWVKLLGADAANYRLVSEKTNKIIPFTGKILEVLKWIQLEDNSSEIANQIRSITNAH